MVKSKDKDPISIEDDDMLIVNFETEFNDELDSVCNVVSIFPIEFDLVIEVIDQSPFVLEFSLFMRQETR